MHLAARTLLWTRPLLALLATAPLAFAPTAAASGLKGQAEIAQTVEWHSNPLMQTQGRQSLLGSTTSPQLTVKNSTPTRKIELNFLANQNIFNHSAFNSTDLHATAKVGQELERWSFELSHRVDSDTTRTSEQTSYGRNDGVTRHLGNTTTPVIAFRPSQLDEISLEGSFTRSTYDRASYIGYETYTATPTYTRHFTALSSGYISTQAQRYRTINGSDVNVDSVGPSLGWTQTLSPRLSVSVATGAQATRQSSNGKPAGPWDWQQTFSGKAAFKGQTDAIDLTATRLQTPHGNGTEALETRFALTATRAINTNLSLRLAGDHQTSHYQQTVSGSVDTQSSGEVGLLYQATDMLGLRTSYRYRHQTLLNTAKPAEDSAVSVQLVIRPNSWTLGP